jgi:hypothetical protein
MIDREAVEALQGELAPPMDQRVAEAVDALVQAKRRGGKIVVVTGSGPNVHEGVTTLIAELMRRGVVDGVTTSSAVVAHEMAGVLDRIKRVDGRPLGLDPSLLPRGGAFELTELDDAALCEIEAEIPLDRALIERIQRTPGETIIKAAGNLGYPMGLWIERLAREILGLARARGLSFEEAAGAGCDPRTMLGVGADRNLPVLVTIPQLVGGGGVGLAIGDSISITERAGRLARMLEQAEVIVESAVALTQEIHDGPLETHTGHGLWAAWQGHPTFTLAGKTLVRIDLDPALEQVWRMERTDQAVQAAIDKGLPKTKLLDVPFRMEMSGFARLESSIAVTGDIGTVWPLLALRVADQLGLDLQFLSYPQQTDRGRDMRNWIVEQVRPISRRRLLQAMTGG